MQGSIVVEECLQWLVFIFLGIVFTLCVLPLCLAAQLLRLLTELCGQVAEAAWQWAARHRTRVATAQRRVRWVSCGKAQALAAARAAVDAASLGDDHRLLIRRLEELRAAGGTDAELDPLKVQLARKLHADLAALVPSLEGGSAQLCSLRELYPLVVHPKFALPEEVRTQFRDTFVRLILLLRVRAEALLGDVERGYSYPSLEEERDDPVAALAQVAFLATAVGVPTAELASCHRAVGCEPSERGRLCYRGEVVAPRLAGRIERLMNSTRGDISTRDRHGPLPRSFRLHRAVRVFNAEAFKRYVAFKEALRREDAVDRSLTTRALGGQPVASGPPVEDEVHRADADVHEVFLLHGTSPSSAEAITEDQFRVDFRGRGGLFGPGIYFAEKSTKADEYAHVAEKGPYRGCRVMLLCRVVLGNAVAVAYGASARGAAHTTIGHAAYREFVVSSADQVYPAYILYYRRDSD